VTCRDVPPTAPPTRGGTIRRLSNVCPKIVRDRRVRLSLKLPHVSELHDDGTGPRYNLSPMRPTLLALALTLPVLAADTPRPVPANEAAQRMTLPAGFRATLFAGEPDVVQPLAMTTDDRGRLWVVECMSYPEWTKETTASDRVVIFEDADGDGRFDKRTVFWDKGANLTGIALGFGGVWLCSTPNLIFIPVRAGEDKPAGPPVVKLDGWNLKAQHNVFNGLTWGPDGWLWGCNGITETSHVGRPGTPDKDRVAMNCGVWRYHPTRDKFEVVAWGTTNPWGVDFDDYGEAFITNCVIDHLWHVIPGAHYERMFGQDLNPHVYSLMGPCSDHRHWAGGHWSTARGGPAHHDSGGGHAHCGTMVYLGDNFPERYRNGVFTCNIHGNRVNHDALKPRGSGYVGTHEPDFLMANDPWFRGVALCYGPDGGVYVADWCDTGECHNYKEVDRSNGRIYKVTHGTPKPWQGDLTKLSDFELARLHSHKNDWFVRHARRLLQERTAHGPLQAPARFALRKTLTESGDDKARLRALWSLHAVGDLEDDDYARRIRDGSESVRAWAIRLALDRPWNDVVAGQLAAVAAEEPSPRVRLALASGLQKMPVDRRWGVAAQLATRRPNGEDPNLPLMIWYGVESIVAADSAKCHDLLLKTAIPIVREYIARRFAERTGGTEGTEEVVRWLVSADDRELERDMLRGLQAAVQGRRGLQQPTAWPEVYRRLSRSGIQEVRDRAAELAVLFGDERVRATLRAVALDPMADANRRQKALQTILIGSQPDLIPVLHGLLADPAMRGAAARGLAVFADPATPREILKRYGEFTEADKADAVATLASRPEYALALLGAVEKGTVPRRDISAYTARQIQALKNREITARLTQVWGAVRTASKERAAQTAKFKSLLTPEYLQAADLPHGRRLFEQNCATCHKLFGEGTAVGPELTGSQRANLDYVLENVLDPNAGVPNDYRATEFELNNGRLVTGLVVRETAQAVTVRTPTEEIVVPVRDIAGRNKSPISMMPEGIFDKLAPDEVRDLVAYLASPRQVPKQ
jgi:putative membrane-bound dehydrogenase-like protein